MNFLMLLLLPFLARAAEPVPIGSKAFTEGYLLGEYVAEKIEAVEPVNRRFGLGGTGILFTSLQSGDIQLYVEYTGTISEAILKRANLTDEELTRSLTPIGLVMSESLGFNNTYALAVTPSFAEKFHLRTLSDFAKIADQARVGLSHEFVERSDGWKALVAAYSFNLSRPVQGMEHSLAYEAIGANQVDVVDVYSTDAKIEKLGLRVLEDDRHFFPAYQAVVLARADFVATHPEVWKVVQSLKGSLDEKTMRKLNAQVDIDKRNYRDVIHGYLHPNEAPTRTGSDFLQRTREHLFLVGFALLFSILVGVPLGILAVRNRYLGQGILLVSGTIQTIPSLALLCFLIPLFGIGSGSALAALCLYGLLPIVMNTFIGLRAIDPSLLEMIQALKLTRWQALVRIRLPLASNAILAGVRTSAVITIGTATLAALIGAGGYGATIVAGLAVNDMSLILAGAVPAAILALIAHGVFEALEYLVVPKGLRL